MSCPGSVHRHAVKLSTAIRRFDCQLRADGKSPHTRAVYLRDLRLLAKWLRHDVNISTITPTKLARFLTSRIFTQTAFGKPKATISINRSKSALRSFFRFLTDAGYLNANPARLIRSAPASQRPPRILTEKETRALLATIKKHKTPIARRDHLMFALLLGTGIRLSSLVNLIVGDVDLASGKIRINGKGNVERLVFLNGGLRRLLKSYLVKRDDATDPLFLSLRARRIGPRQVELRLTYWLELAGITCRCSVHTLRHTFATRLYEKTNNLRLVQRALGHRRVTTTEIYTQLADADLACAIRDFG